MLFLELEAFYKDPTSPYEGRCLCLASLMDLYVMFQPSIRSRFNFPVFEAFELALLKEDVINIVDTIEKLVFDEPEDIVKQFYKQEVMQAYESFYCNYQNLPSLTSWESLLRHYNAKVPFKTEIEHIMEHALKKEKSGIFEKTVAFAILNKSTENDVDRFRAFYNALESFLKLHQPDVKARSRKLSTICSFILEKVARFLLNNRDYDKRLAILDYVTIIVKNLELTYKQNLGSFMDLSKVKLDINEKSKVEAFLRLLKEK